MELYYKDHIILGINEANIASKSKEIADNIKKHIGDNGNVIDAAVKLYTEYKNNVNNSEVIGDSLNNSGSSTTIPQEAENVKVAAENFGKE